MAPCHVLDTSAWNRGKTPILNEQMEFRRDGLPPMKEVMGGKKVHNGGFIDMRTGADIC